MNGAVYLSLFSKNDRDNKKDKIGPTCTCGYNNPTCIVPPCPIHGNKKESRELFGGSCV